MPAGIVVKPGELADPVQCGDRRSYGDISVSTSERTGIVIELKYANDGNMEAACAEALRQIEEKKYAIGLLRQGMKKIIRYGMAFWEKECMVGMA